jgi:serine/threonine-protein kinase
VSGDQHATTPTIAPGARLDRYQLLAPVAEGGMGQVWLARLLGTRGFEKLVAIKVPKLSGDVHAQQMLLDEARIASRIEHANVAQIIELGEQGDVLYIVMEWVDGDALSTLLRVLDKKNVPLPPAIALRIVADTCAGAHAAHELRGPDGNAMGVVHRDISPQNMLITRAGTVKLIDFGIAKARSRLSGDTSEGILKGKIKYMAPEQALGKPIDRRADVFSLGAVLYRMLAGRPPYEAENEVATLHRLVAGGPPPLLPSSVPKPVADVVYRALAPSPDGRFPTAAEMQQAILRAMAQSDLVAEPPDVGAFVAAHLADRQQRRAHAIEAALKAAADQAPIAVPWPAPLSSASSVNRTATGYESGSYGTGPHSSSTSATSGRAGPLVIDESVPRPAPRSLRHLASAALALGAIGAVLIGIVAFTGTGRFRTAASEGTSSTVPVLAGDEVASVASAQAAPASVAGASAQPEEPEPTAIAEAPPKPSATASPPPRAATPQTPRPPPRPAARQPKTPKPDFGY